MRFFILLALITSKVAFASKEGVLPTTSFQIESSWIGSSGVVAAKGKRNLNGKFESISVFAFGKTLVVGERLLEKIPPSSNGIQLSYEQGYKDSGGRTVYLIFLKGFTTGSKEKIALSVNESGESNLVH